MRIVDGIFSYLSWRSDRFRKSIDKGLLLIDYEAMNKGRLFCIFQLIFLLLPLTVMADPLPQRPVVIGCDPDFPPYEFVGFSGEPDGLNVELGRAISAAMGVEVVFRYAPWHELRRQLLTGQVDILSGVPYSKQGQLEFDYTPPHAQVFQSLWVRRDSPYSSLEALAGQQVLVVRDSVMASYLAEHPQLRVEAVAVDSLEDALRLLAIGDYDAALGSKLAGEYLLGRLQVANLKAVGRPLLAEDYGFAVKAGNQEMLALLTEGLALLKQSGEYRRIFNAWLGPLPEVKGLELNRVLRIGGAILIPLVVILLLALLWSALLRRQVRLRTAALKEQIREREQAMAELKRHQQQLIQADKLASLGVLVSGVAHEINNPNGMLLLDLAQLQRIWRDIEPLLEEHYAQQGNFRAARIPWSQLRDEIPEMLEEMLKSSGRIKWIVEDLKNFARREDVAQAKDVDLNQVAMSAYRLVENQLKKATDQLHIELDAGLPLVTGHGQRLEQVIVNLLINASQALANRRQAIILRTRATQERVIVEVEDQGRGIAPEHLPQLTDPFFTTRREEGGTGLGLSVSAQIVQEHDGELEFVPLVSGGTLVRMSLPKKRGVDGD